MGEDQSIVRGDTPHPQASGPGFFKRLGEEAAPLRGLCISPCLQVPALTPFHNEFFMEVNKFFTPQVGFGYGVLSQEVKSTCHQA